MSINERLVANNFVEDFQLPQNSGMLFYDFIDEFVPGVDYEEGQTGRHSKLWMDKDECIYLAEKLMDWLPDKKKFRSYYRAAADTQYVDTIDRAQLWADKELGDEERMVNAGIRQLIRWLRDCGGCRMDYYYGDDYEFTHWDNMSEAQQLEIANENSGA